MHAYQEKFINSHFSFCNFFSILVQWLLCVFINFNYENCKRSLTHTHARTRTHARMMVSFPLIKNMSFVCIHMIVLLDHT